MKTPYLKDWQRIYLKAYREKKEPLGNLPLFVSSYENALACRKLKRAAVAVGVKHFSKMLWITLILFILFLISLLGCVTPLEQRVPECVVVEKNKNFFKGYSFVLDSHYISVSKKEFNKYQIGDTIKK